MKRVMFVGGNFHHVVCGRRAVFVFRFAGRGWGDFVGHYRIGGQLPIRSPLP